MKMIKEFNTFFGIREDMPLQRVKLEDALIKKYGSIQYHQFQTTYTIGTKFEWEDNLIECEMGKYTSPDEALMGLFIEQCTEPPINTNEDISRYYTELNKKDEVGFREIIKEVYHVE